MQTGRVQDCSRPVFRPRERKISAEQPPFAALPGEDGDQLVRLASAANPAQAHIWENALRAEGMYCEVLGDYLNAGIGNISGLQSEIWAKRRDLVRARALLERCGTP